MPNKPTRSHTITEAAAAVGMNSRTARNLCVELGLGILVNPRLRLLSDADVAQLRKKKRSRGNPNFVKKTKQIAV